MEISVMTYGHPLWENTISFAENCSWKAGPYLAKMMRNKEFSETERVFVASEGDEIIGYCTFAKKDELLDDAQYTPFIGFVFIDEKSRVKGLIINKFRGDKTILDPGIDMLFDRCRML